MSKFEFVCFVVAAFCVAEFEAAVTQAQRIQVQTKLLTTGLECMKDHPLSLEQINIFRKKQVPDDEASKCFINCMYRKLGVMNDKGKISEKGAKKSARQLFKDGDEIIEKIDELFGKCMHVNDEETSDGEKGCIRAALAATCFMEHAPALGLDFEF